MSSLKVIGYCVFCSMPFTSESRRAGSKCFCKKCKADVRVIPFSKLYVTPEKKEFARSCCSKKPKNGTPERSTKETSSVLASPNICSINKVAEEALDIKVENETSFDPPAASNEPLSKRKTELAASFVPKKLSKKSAQLMMMERLRNKACLLLTSEKFAKNF